MGTRHAQDSYQGSNLHTSWPKVCFNEANPHSPTLESYGRSMT